MCSPSTRCEKWMHSMLCRHATPESPKPVCERWVPFYVPVWSPSPSQGWNSSSHSPSPIEPSLSPSPGAQHCRPAGTASLPQLQPPRWAQPVLSSWRGLPGVTGLSVTLRPCPCLWSWGHAAALLKVTSGRENRGGTRGARGLSICPIHRGGGVAGVGWGGCFCSGHTIVSPRDPLAGPPFSALPSSLGSCYSQASKAAPWAGAWSWIWGCAEYGRDGRAGNGHGLPTLALGHQRGQRRISHNCACQWASETRHKP